MADVAFCTEVPRPAPVRRSVLVTGAAGRIGSAYCEHAHRHRDLVLMVHSGESAGEGLRRYGRVQVADLADLSALTRVCQGIHTAVHLAAVSDPNGTWDELLSANIVGTYNMFIAAKAAGCRRVIYASSIHAVSGYPLGRQVHADDPVNPGDLYGVSKCFGEAMARYMALQQGLSCIVLRIGAFQPLEAARDLRSLAMMDAFISPRDMNHLLDLCIDDDRLQFAILHALSNNAFNRLDITRVKELIGYAPQDDFTREHPELRDLRITEQLQTHTEQGGQQPGIREELEEVRGTT